MKFPFIKKLKALLHNTILLINIVFVIFLLVSYLSARTNPQFFWMVALFGLAYPFLVIINAGFVIYWIARWRIVFLFSFIAIIAGWSHLSSTFQVRFTRDQPRETANTFTFLSYNVRLFNLYNWINDPGLKNSIYELILGEDPDILCIQEYFYNSNDPYNNTRNFRRLHDRYKHIAYSSTNGKNFNFGIATFSRYPIINSGNIKFINSSNISIYSDIVINSDTVRVFNNHLQSVQFTPENKSFLDSLGRHNSRRNIAGGIDIAYKLKEAFIRRSRQVDIIVRHIQESPYPVIITGDLNDTPVSYTYRRLRGQDLDDAFVVSGRGTGNTYVARVPFFRIDYILHSRQLQSFYYNSPRVILSDHYPLKCEFSFRTEE
jgi:endonuclease/exonuclease/phosphatase family metal-dependent hydrolase